MSDQDAVPSETTNEPEIEAPIVDIDAALASVASLSDVLTEQEVQEETEQAIQHRPQDYDFPYPPPFRLQRGQLASVTPALTLIGIGVWLTFTLTTSDEAPSTLLVLLVFAVGFAFSMIAYWASTERWPQGALFGALLVVFVGATLVYLANDDELGTDGWPLVVSVSGMALMLSALLSRTVLRGYQALIGLIGIVSGLVGLAVTTDVLGTGVTQWARSSGPFLLIVLVFLLILPLFLNRN